MGLEVCRECRRRGIGTALLTKVLDEVGHRHGKNNLAVIAPALLLLVFLIGRLIVNSTLSPRHGCQTGTNSGLPASKTGAMP